MNHPLTSKPLPESIIAGSVCAADEFILERSSGHRNVRIWSALLLVVCGFLATGCDSSRSESKTLRVGCDLTYPPFEILGANNQPSGFGVELAQAFAASVGKEVEIVPISFDSLINKLREGEIDLIVSSMSITLDRIDLISFSAPYARTGLATLVATESPIKKTGDLEASGIRITVRPGTTAHKFCMKKYPDAEIVLKTEDFACVLAVTTGEADAYVYDQLAIWRFQKNHPDTTRAILDFLVEEDWGIGVRHDDKDLLLSINRFLSEFQDGGGMENLADKYLSEEREMLKAIGLPFILK